MEIKTVPYDREAHLPLLLEADPYEGAVERYIGRSLVYVAQEGGIVAAIAAVTREADGFELKNIAVRPGLTGRGIGGALLERIKADCAGSRLYVGTADVSSAPLAFYQKHGFKVCGVRKNFFVDNYPQPLYDDGSQCIDMVILELTEGTEG